MPWNCYSVMLILAVILWVSDRPGSADADAAAPAEFFGFDWGAFFWTLLWALGHGLRRWAAGFLLVAIVSGVVFNYLRQSPDLQGAFIAHLVLSPLLSMEIAYVFARRARLLYWRHRYAEVSAEPEALRRVVELFGKRRVVWLVSGAILFVSAGVRSVYQLVTVLR